MLDRVKKSTIVSYIDRYTVLEMTSTQNDIIRRFSNVGYNKNHHKENLIFNQNDSKSDIFVRKYLWHELLHIKIYTRLYILKH